MNENGIIQKTMETNDERNGKKIEEKEGIIQTKMERNELEESWLQMDLEMSSFWMCSDVPLTKPKVVIHQSPMVSVRDNYKTESTDTKMKTEEEIHKTKLTTNVNNLPLHRGAVSLSVFIIRFLKDYVIEAELSQKPSLLNLMAQTGLRYLETKLPIFLHQAFINSKTTLSDSQKKLVLDLIQNIHHFFSQPLESYASGKSNELSIDPLVQWIMKMLQKSIQDEVFLSAFEEFLPGLLKEWLDIFFSPSFMCSLIDNVSLWDIYDLDYKKKDIMEEIRQLIKDDSQFCLSLGESLTQCGIVLLRLTRNYEELNAIEKTLIRMISMKAFKMQIGASVYQLINKLIREEDFEFLKPLESLLWKEKEGKPFPTLVGCHLLTISEFGCLQDRVEKKLSNDLYEFVLENIKASVPDIFIPKNYLKTRIYTLGSKIYKDLILQRNALKALFLDCLITRLCNSDQFPFAHLQY